MGELGDDRVNAESGDESATSDINRAEEMDENRKAWDLAVESEAVLYDEEDDIMKILQEQNEALARKKMGLGGVGKKSMVKVFRRKFNVHMLGLIETKKENLTKFDIVQLRGTDGVGWEFVGAEGASGGLLLMWDVTMFKMSNCHKGVYGEHVQEEKLVVWKELSFLSGLCQERKGTTSLSVAAVEFKLWIEDMELVDLVLSDRRFTWFRGQSCSRIDRALVSLEWLEEFSETRLHGGPRGLLDHCPIIMEVTRRGGGPRPFWSLDSWFTHAGFLGKVKDEWRSLGEAPFMDNLKALTGPLSRWHRENFGDIDKRIDKFEEEIRKVDDLVSDGVYDGAAEAMRKALVSACKKWYIRKEIHSKQMSRSRHAKKMDKNTRYFHNIASARMRNNRIDALRVQGRLVMNHFRIKSAIRDFYKGLYHQEASPNIGFRDGLVRKITEKEATGLEVMGIT
ncbi:uncharacterized protein LOC107611302 [Arachis ipaensis]|uniref:uncharacterized protein LOC107611302 n=1 Tax=Arachis ipaensis TaxID=130454 RepID=UPI0007AF1761|nr:uncharacterized protein LOC107611302 [Arachis ipaensis]